MKKGKVRSGVGIFFLPVLNVAWEHIVTFSGVLLPTASGNQATKSFPANFPDF